MDVFLEPAVIVSITISLIIAIFANKLAILGDFLLQHFGVLPKKLKTWIRAKEWKRRKNIILLTRNQTAITWQIARTYALLVIFIFIAIIYLLLVTIGPLKVINSLPSSAQLLIASPVFISEVLWIIQREKTLSLVKITGQRINSKIRVTRKSR